MLITCWGARGSIPVSGKDYVEYGGDTTCMEIRRENQDPVIIDAGSGIRRLGNRMLAERQGRFDMIFTHSHWDHLLGFPFFKPLYFKGTAIRMYGCPFAQKSIREMFAKTMSPPYFPVNLNDVKGSIEYNETCDNDFSLGAIEVKATLLSHPNQGIGYKFMDTESGGSFVFLTDNEITYKHPGGLEYADYLDFCRGADLLIHDAEYMPEEYKLTRTWGHSVYTDVLDMAIGAGVKRLGLFHHNQERTDKQVDEMAANCVRIVKERGAGLECFAVKVGQEMEV
ncbi:MBL fold metallo-hydrolase [Fibrobacterota bacterium]